MATDPVQPVPAPQLPERPGLPQPVKSVDWFRRMPTGGGTVYVRSVD
ncbi:hypothetical protein ACSHWB_20845 [Lentzea sp. HUAS TT2]